MGQDRDSLERLIREIDACKICGKHLPLGPKPVFSVSSQSKILIVGQAPGAKFHASGIPWDDQSGKELRRWLGVDKETFYDTSVFGILPMGFCYPGRGKGGAMPPRPECAPTWHQLLLNQMPHLKLIILIGQYAQAYYLADRRKKRLTDTVRQFAEYLPCHFPLVHPSPRNKAWMKRNPWFEVEVLPELRNQVGQII